MGRVIAVNSDQQQLSLLNGEEQILAWRGVAMTPVLLCCFNYVHH